MQFTTPQNKAQLYSVLKEIFYYYRIRRDEYEDFVLPELDLERMDFTPKTQEELTEIARSLLLSKHIKEEKEYVDKLKDAKSLLTKKRDNVEIQKNSLINALLVEHEKSVLNVKKEAQKKGLEYSSVIADKLLELENLKTQKIAKINEDATKEYDDLSMEIENVDNALNGASEYCNSIFDAEINAKVIELSKEQEETQKEVFKYNNTIEEKCQRYKGTVATTNATLRLRYLDINTEFFSKEQLIEMGYYEDVINCVCSYYDTLSAIEAYRDIIQEEKLTIYLEDYYQDLIYMYRSRAGL